LTAFAVDSILRSISKNKVKPLEGELWVPQDRFLAPLSYQSEPSSFLRRVGKGFGKIRVVFPPASSYNCIGFCGFIIISSEMNKRRYLFQAAWLFVGALLVCSCVGKKPDDDVVLIKQLLALFERGIEGANTTVLDSIALGERGEISSQLLDSLSEGSRIEGARIAKKSFVIVGDSAEVKLKLDLKYATSSEEAESAEIPLRLYLVKKRGKWKINGFAMGLNEKQQTAPETEP
jgi:hypothetical protein